MSSYILDIVKNPIFIGLFGTIITYSYFYWTDSKTESPNEKKKKKSNFTYHILVSLCVGLILGLGSYIYFDMTNTEPFVNTGSGELDNSIVQDTPIVTQKVNSINVPSKSLVIPHNLPDVFIETFEQ